jgi:hypothetical protein
LDKFNTFKLHTGCLSTLAATSGGLGHSFDTEKRHPSKELEMESTLEVDKTGEPSAGRDRQKERKVSDRTAMAVHEDVMRVTRGRPSCWVSVHEIAQRLGLEDEVVAAAVQSAIDLGWFVGDGNPPHSVRLAIASMQELS